MSFDNFGELLAMGGHGQYVWTSYGLALVILLFNIARPLMLNRRIVAERKRQLLREMDQGTLEG